MITRHDNILIVLFPESEIEKGCADIFLTKKIKIHVIILINILVFCGQSFPNSTKKSKVI